MQHTQSKQSGFFSRVYDVVEKIPAGKVMTYGQIAEILGNVCSARYVGYAMASAPAARDLPCHRVVNKAGEMAGSGTFGGAATQRNVLEAEGVVFKDNGRIDMTRSLFRPFEE